MDEGSETTPVVPPPTPPVNPIPAGPPPAGAQAVQTVIKALLNWIQFGQMSGPMPTPPTTEERTIAQNLAEQLASGQATITRVPA